MSRMLVRKMSFGGIAAFLLMVLSLLMLLPGMVVSAAEKDNIANLYVFDNSQTIQREGYLDVGMGRSAKITVNGYEHNSTQCVDLTSEVEYISSAPDVAVVDKDGMVQGLAVGEAEITAKYRELSFSFKVYVHHVIFPGEPKVVDSKGAVVDAVNLGYIVRYMPDYMNVDGQIKPPPTGTYYSKNFYWNETGYEFIGWVLAEGEPLLGEVSLGTGYTRKEDHPVSQYVKQRDGSKAFWNFWVWAASDYDLQFTASNVELTANLVYYPVFQLKDGYDPSVPISETDDVVAAIPTRYEAEPLTAASFAGAELMDVREGIYGSDLFDIYEVKVPGEGNSFSFDVPLPESGADALRIWSEDAYDTDIKSWTTEVIGDVLRVTVSYSEKTVFSVEGSAVKRAGSVYVSTNFPKEAKWGGTTDNFHRTYTIQYYREAASGVKDAEYNFNVKAANLTFEDAGYEYSEFSRLDSQSILLNATYLCSVSRYWVDEAMPRLEKFVINGVDVPIPKEGSTREYTYTIPDTAGGTATVYFATEYGWEEYPHLNLRFDGMMPTHNVDVELVFIEQKPDCLLDVVSTDMTKGTIGEVKFDHKDSAGRDVYTIQIKLTEGYAVDRLTANGKRLVLQPLNTDWERQTVLSANSWTTEITGLCQNYEVAIDKNTELKVSFKPWDYQISLIGYAPSGSNLSIATPSRANNGSTDDVQMLYPGLKGAEIRLSLDTEGWYYASDKYDSEVATNNTLCVYAGTKVQNEDTLLVSYDDFSMGGWHGSKELKFNIPYIWDNTEFTVIVNRNGKIKKISFDVRTITEISAVRELYEYYRDNFGDDKFGAAAFTESEKLTEGYRKYVKYAGTRMYLRATLENALEDIVASESDKRRQKLALAKEELQLAAAGVGGYTGISNCAGLTSAIVAPNEELGYRGDTSSAVTLMAACLEAEYPANWTFCISGDGIVMGFYAGGTGKISIVSRPEGSGGAGFWYTNGVFADIGAAGYRLQDGDICTWGGGGIQQVGETKSQYSQTQLWDQVMILEHYSDDELLARCTELHLLNNEGRPDLANCTVEELERFFPEVDFTRFGRNREMNNIDKVKALIFDIGSVTPESGPAIKAARAAYEALSSDEKALLGRARQYPVLTNMERYYEMVTTAVASDPEKTRELLMNYKGGVSTLNTTAAMLGLVSAVQNDYTPGDAAKVGSLIASLNNDLNNRPGGLTEYADLYGKKYYATLVLSLTAMGYNAANYLDNDGEFHDFTSYLRNFDDIASGGAEAVAWTLIALDSKPYDANNVLLREQYVDWLLSHQRADGTWGDNIADPAITALAISALSVYQDEPDVLIAINKAVAALKGFQSKYGGLYDAYGLYSPITTTMAVIALCDMNIDVADWRTESGGDPLGALINFYRAEDVIFQMVFDETDRAGVEPMTALAAYVRYKEAKSRVFDLRSQFGETYRLQVPGTLDESTIIAELDGLMMKKAVDAALAESSLVLHLQMIAAQARAQDEYAKGYSDWTPVNADDTQDVASMEAISADRYKLKMDVTAAKLLGRVKLALTLETPLGTISLDEGLVTELAEVTARDVFFDINAVDEQHTNISVVVDGVAWQSSREASVSLPVETPDPGLVIALVNGDEEEVFWKVTVVRHAMAAEVNLPCVLRIYKPSFVYGDVAEDSRFAGAAQFAAARNLFDDENGIFGANDTVNMVTVLRALYQLEDNPDFIIERVDPDAAANDGFVLWQRQKGQDESYADVSMYLLPEDAEYNKYLIWGIENGIIPYTMVRNYDGNAGLFSDIHMGIEDGETGEWILRHQYYHIEAETPISRDQAATILYGYATYLGLDTSNEEDLSGFEDYTRMPTVQWNLSRYSHLSWAVYEGLIGGDDDNRLDPTGLMTKGNLAQMLQSMSINLSGGVRGDDGNSDGTASAAGGTPDLSMMNNTEVTEHSLETEKKQEHLEEEMPPEEPDEQFDVDADVIQVTKDSSWLKLLPIVLVCLLAAGAAGWLLVSRRRNK